MFLTNLFADLRHIREQALLGSVTLLGFWLVAGPHLPTQADVLASCVDFSAPCGRRLDVLWLRAAQELGPALKLAIFGIAASLVGHGLLDLLSSPIRWLGRRAWFGGQPDWAKLQEVVASANQWDDGNNRSVPFGKALSHTELVGRLTSDGEDRLAGLRRDEADGSFRLLGGIASFALWPFLIYRGGTSWILFGAVPCLLLLHAQFLGGKHHRAADREILARHEQLFEVGRIVVSHLERTSALQPGVYSPDDWPSDAPGPAKQAVDASKLFNSIQNSIRLAQTKRLALGPVPNRLDLLLARRVETSHRRVIDLDQDVERFGKWIERAPIEGNGFTISSLD